MGRWSKASRSHADYMRDGDFYSAEQSITMQDAGDVRIEFVAADGSVTIKKELSLEQGEVLIEHTAIGLNFIDTYQRSGLYPVSLPSGLGSEAAGIVRAVGPGRFLL